MSLSRPKDYLRYTEYTVCGHLYMIYDEMITCVRNENARKEGGGTNNLHQPAAPRSCARWLCPQLDCLSCC